MFSGLFKKNVATVQMLNKVTQNAAQSVAQNIAQVTKQPLQQKDDDSSSEEGEAPDDTPEVAKTVDVQVEAGGGMGWPSDVSTILYHNSQGTICVGTESGVVYAYGDGFQFMRPQTKDEGVSVKHIVALDPDLILVAFSDNSIDVLELPSLNLIGDLSSSWVGPKNGNITALHVDIPGEKNYTYIGTSEGSLQVIDVTDSTVRVCDFLLTWKTIGLTSAMSISDIQMCPKDEKFLAVSFEGKMVHQGAVVIFDLSKMKAHRVFETKAMLSLAWNHTGDALYGGTKDGAVLHFSADKPHFASPWNASSERASEEEDDDLDLEEEAVSIRRLHWMAPQPPSLEGCLFALLGSPGPDNDNLKSIVVGLSPIGSHGDMETVFCLPSIPQENVLQFAIVPSYLKSEAEQALRSVPDDEEDEDTDNHGTDPRDMALRRTITPAVMLLTQWHATDEDDDPDQTMRNLKVVRCPTVDMACWALEVGQLQDPRFASEVLPGRNNVTCISGLVPENSVLSLSQVLIRQCVAQGCKVSIKPRTVEEDWEVVLAEVDLQEYGGKKPMSRIQDVVVKGYENGHIIAWGVSLPESRGNIWQPLMTARCGKAEVTCISHDESAGLLVAGDAAGALVIWEIYEEGSGMSASEVLRQVHANATAFAQRKAFESAAAAKKRAMTPTGSAHGSGAGDEESDGSDAEADHSTHNPEITEYGMYSSYNFNSCKEVLRTKLHNHITAVLLIAQFSSVVVGTEDGTVYICASYSSVLFSEIEGLEKCGARGSVAGLTFGNFLLADRHSVAAIYVAFSCGNVAVVQLSTLQMVAYGPTLHSKYTSMLAEGPKCSANHELCLTDGAYNRMHKPSLKDAALVMAEEALQPARTAPEPVNAKAAANTTSPMRGLGGFKPFSDVKTQLTNAAQATAQALNLPPLPGDKSTTDMSQEVAPIKRPKIPFRRIPRYLTMLMGKLLLTFDLHRFTRVSTKTCLPGHGGNALVVKVISQKQMINTSFLSYNAEIDEGDSDDGREGNMLCAASVNAHGLMVLISVKQKALINHSQLVEEALSAGQSLESGVILPNGNAYLVREGGEMVYSATVNLINSPLRLPYPHPDRASPGASPPKAGFQLLHGRESMLASQRAAVRKRRSSVLKISSAPFELAKIFAKTRDQRQKDELMGAGQVEEDRARSGSSSTYAKGATTKATGAKAGLNETKDAFNLRGEKINRAALKADEIKDSAQQFNKAVKEQKEQLQKKSNRWGLF